VHLLRIDPQYKRQQGLPRRRPDTAPDAPLAGRAQFAPSIIPYDKGRASDGVIGYRWVILVGTGQIAGIIPGNTRVTSCYGSVGQNTLSVGKRVSAIVAAVQPHYPPRVFG
jgi:hypothetical protein